MACKRWIIAATGACALTMMVGGAQSAPFGSAATELGATSAAKSGFKRVAYRLCWTEGGARQCRWVDNARIYGYRASAVSGYGPARAYRSSAPRVFGYVAPRVYGYRSPRVYPYAAPAVYGYGAAPVYAYAAPTFGYQAPAVYGAGAPIVRFYPRPLDYANPNEYPTGTRAWWAVMGRQDRDGRPE
jgi:hypothetical protein